VTKNFLVIFCVIVFVGCTGNLDSNSADPGGGNNTSANTGSTVTAESAHWTQISYEYLAPNPPANCSSPEMFVVNNDMSWKWNWCAQQKAGTLTNDEMVTLNGRIESVEAVGFVPQTCTQVSFSGSLKVSVVFKPATQKVLHTLDSQGSCYTSPPNKVNELELYLAQLRAKYTGFDINPALGVELSNGE
jgi:hypothetical protein